MADSGFYISHEDWEQYETLDGLLYEFNRVYNKITDYTSSFQAVSFLISTIRNMEVQDRVMTELMQFFEKRNDLVLLAKNTEVKEAYAVRIYGKYTGYTSWNDKFQEIIPDDVSYTEPYKVVKEILTPLPQPNMFQFEYEYIIPFRNVSGLDSDKMKSVMNGLKPLLGAFFNKSDLVSWSSPHNDLPATVSDNFIADFVTMVSSTGGAAASVVNVVLNLMQLYAQAKEMYKTNIIGSEHQDLWNVFIGGPTGILWPNVDPMEMLASTIFHTGAEFRTFPNDYYLNRFLTRALNYGTGSNPEDKVVKEIEDLEPGIDYGDFKYMWPFLTLGGSPVLLYMSNEIPVLLNYQAPF